MSLTENCNKCLPYATVAFVIAIPMTAFAFVIFGIYKLTHPSSNHHLRGSEDQDILQPGDDYNKTLGDTADYLEIT